NEDTITVFKFLMPGIKLPKRKVIDSRVLIKSAKLLQENIIKIAKNDIDEVTMTFDSWTNIKQEHLWNIVFITTGEQSLI
ncbi:411_t:CDS:1, partial [Racocetra persica]